jgi:hypothetical protein
MLVQDLFEVKLDIPVKKGRHHGLFPNQDKVKYLGSGVQSIAYELTKKPNSILKVINLQDLNDPTIAFIRVCMNHQDNPYFPRIYKMRVFESNRIDPYEYQYLFNLNNPPINAELPLVGDYVAFVVMERLHSVDVVNPDVHQHIGKQLVSLGVIPDKDAMNIKIGGSWRRMDLSKYFDTHEKRHNIINNCQDRDFCEAMRILEPVFRRHKPDMHMGNLMARRSNDGIQLVIMDPVTYGKGN